MSIQLNVQQQNHLAFEAMLRTARGFREKGVALGLIDFFFTHGIDVNSSAIVFAQTESYMLGFAHGLGGLLVTSDKQYYSFNLELDETLMLVTWVHEFSDVTAEQNMSARNRGTGQGEGAVAAAVLDALNIA